MSKIIVAGNGPSCQSPDVSAFLGGGVDRVFRTNYYFMPERDPLLCSITDWFICEVESDCRCVRALSKWSPDDRPRIWFPGIDMDFVRLADETHLRGYDVRVQREFARLPAACRWEKDLRPFRPLMGSFAIAVAVGFKPDEICICGHDLFMHPSGGSHGGMSFDTRPWQRSFNEQYVNNTHRNHRVKGDVDYIRKALREYKGHVRCVGTVLREIFRDEFPEWEWKEG